MTITPSDAQNAAIKEIVAWYEGGPATPQVFYLGGYAGTGKSTIAKFAIEEVRRGRSDFRVATAAFTGKAASVLRRKGNPDACTFHSGMYMPVENQTTGKVEFKLVPEAPFGEANLIVGDECSMIDAVLGRDAESFGKKLLIMGDPGQLPPVGGDGYWTSRDPDVMLTEVHRQAMDSPILRLATMAREGRDLPLGQAADADGNVSRVLAHNSVNQVELYREETQPICGVHRVRWGYTGRIRARRGFSGPRPEVGEQVICTRNNKQLGIFNGGFGIVRGLGRRRAGDDADTFRMDVQMEDLPEPINFLKGLHVHPWMFDQHADSEIKRPYPFPRGAQEFDWGYMLTCHKAQGSEWEDVTVVGDGGAFRQDRHRWTYTALTRASKRVTFLKRT